VDIPESITTDLWLITETITTELSSKVSYEINRVTEVFHTAWSYQRSTGTL